MFKNIATNVQKNKKKNVFYDYDKISKFVHVYFNNL